MPFLRQRRRAARGMGQRPQVMSGLGDFGTMIHWDGTMEFCFIQVPGQALYGLWGAVQMMSGPWEI